MFNVSALAVLGVILIGISSINAKTIPKLIGGQQVQKGSFPSTVVLYTKSLGCTAARVGPKHLLTAAHCLIDSKTSILKEDYKQDQRLLITNNPAPQATNSEWQSLTIKRSFLHPSYFLQASTNASLGKSSNALAIKTFDIAIIEVVERINDSIIPIAQLDFKPARVYENVHIMGFGCEDKVGNGTKPDGFPYGRLKSSLTVVNAPDMIEEYGPAKPSLEPNQSYFTIANFNFFTSAPRFDGTAAGLCPGDSGGPVYRRDFNGLSIIGVNSYYSFKQGEHIPYFNWHTRLSKVRNWLLDILYPSGE